MTAAIDEPYILLPVKGLGASKTRLSPILSADERGRLTLLMLEDVMESVGGYRNAYVVTGDAVVDAFSREHSFRVIESNLGDLNADLAYARSRCVAAGASSLLYLLPDLPALKADDVGRMTELSGDAPSAVIGPSRDGGTNALLLKPCTLIEPSFGRLSLERPKRSLRQVGVEPKIYSSLGTELDLDSPEDARRLIEIGVQLRGGGRALSYLNEIGAERLGGASIEVHRPC